MIKEIKLTMEGLPVTIVAEADDTHSFNTIDLIIMDNRTRTTSEGLVRLSDKYQSGELDHELNPDFDDLDKQRICDFIAVASAQISIIAAINTLACIHV